MNGSGTPFYRVPQRTNLTLASFLYAQICLYRPLEWTSSFKTKNGIPACSLARLKPVPETNLPLLSLSFRFVVSLLSLSLSRDRRPHLSPQFYLEIWRIIIGKRGVDVGPACLIQINTFVRCLINWGHSSAVLTVLQHNVLPLTRSFVSNGQMESTWPEKRR